MTIYCEGSAAAEVTFSLTGGREGRIMSYSPPVEVKFETNYILIGLRDYSDGRGMRDGEPPDITYGYNPDNVELAAGTSYFNGTKMISKILQRIPGTNQYTVFLEFPSDSREISYKSGKNVFLIRDSEGLLYFHSMPVKPSYNVRCIGCQQGECAGSDGKGGVICLNCNQMESDIKYMRYKL